MAAHNELGRWGEEMAVRHLQQQGYTIVERDWKSGHRDIDVIALDGSTVVFVEVKTRRNRLFGDPAEAVGYRKLKNLQQAINHYVKSHRLNSEVRFDIVTVVGHMAPNPAIDHLVDVPII